MLSVLMKPASGCCNLRCRYCFYSEEMHLRGDAEAAPFMSREVLEATVQKAFAVAHRQVSFVFQGGEPTLVGAAFYEEFLRLVERYNRSRLPVQLAFQTNGLRIDDEFVRFFRENRVLVGISLDGMADLHNRNRLDAAGRGTYSRVLAAAERLRKAEVDVNILSVLTDEGARHAGQTYRFLTERGFRWLQFISCLPPMEAGGESTFALSPERWLSAHKTLFDLWYVDAMAGKGVSLRFFDNILSMLCGYPPESCDMSGRCTLQYVVEADGSVYPCDFYALPNYRMGNILAMDFEKLANSEAARRFLDKRHAPAACAACAYAPICRGGCPRLYEDGQYRFCKVMPAFLSYSLPRFQTLAARLLSTP